jgi:hypothetical protein
MAIKKLETLITNFADTIADRFSNEPLDGDEVDIIVDRLRAEINLRQGNTTLEEYNDDENIKNWKNWFDCEACFCHIF